MPRKRSAQEDAEAGKPKQLRKRLRKAEDQLADAQSRRDRAEARVEALSIIADEIRAQLAEAEMAAEQEVEKSPAPARKRTTAKSAAPSESVPAATGVRKPAATGVRKPAATGVKKPAATEQAPAQ